VNWSGALPGSSEWVRDTARRPATADERRTDRVQSWRRRVLQKRGALMHAAMAGESENRSLAMLDENGFVVSWYAQAAGAASEHVVDRHVSQFYTPEDIARNQPLRDLRSAVVGGTITRQGWRRQADGTTFWGTVVIEAVVLRDGRLQGFSYVTRASIATSMPRRRAEQHAV
jgi:PAS domain S-box-containing protein